MIRTTRESIAPFRDLEPCWLGMWPGSFSRTRQPQIIPHLMRESACCRTFGQYFVSFAAMLSRHGSELQILKTSPDTTEICVERVKPLRPANWTQPRTK